MATAAANIDMDKTKNTAEHGLDLLGGALASGMVYLKEGRFALSPEAAMVLADENSPLFLADIHGQPTFEKNLTDNPLAALMYGFSVLSCMSWALSEPGGAGLGTLGFPEPVARRMVAEAGFTHFTSHDFANPTRFWFPTD
jgi:hypothetical protein